MGLEQMKPIDESMQAFKVLGKYLEDDGWHPTTLEEQFAYYMRHSGKHGFMHVYARIRKDLEQLICYASINDRVPQELLPKVAEFITRANYGLRLGNFELDYADGEVRYKSSIDFKGIPLFPELIRNTLYAAVQSFDRYLPGLLNVIYGGKSAEEAITDVEK